ncbi:hypothetical protein FRB96_007107 [Tulasnella sp. 330]|nr:hypothetical protein FRB96_007107 [Tulasnella sp. 330]
MADAGFFKGTSADQDSRFKNKDAILRKTIKFPPEFDTKVDVKKVALPVIRPWVVKRLEEKLGMEDEILVEYVMTKLEENRFPDPKAMQIEITGFLRAKTPEFMIELWKLLMSAQNSTGGVPIEFVEEKKQEMRLKQEADQKVMQEVSRRADLDRGNTERLDEIRERERERNERRGGGGGGRGDVGGGREEDGDVGAITDGVAVGEADHRQEMVGGVGAVEDVAIMDHPEEEVIEIGRHRGDDRTRLDPHLADDPAHSRDHRPQHNAGDIVRPPALARHLFPVTHDLDLGLVRALDHHLCVGGTLHARSHVPVPISTSSKAPTPSKRRSLAFSATTQARCYSIPFSKSALKRSSSTTARRGLRLEDNLLQGLQFPHAATGAGANPHFPHVEEDLQVDLDLVRGAAVEDPFRLCREGEGTTLVAHPHVVAVAVAVHRLETGTDHPRLPPGEEVEEFAGVPVRPEPADQQFKPRRDLLRGLARARRRPAAQKVEVEGAVIVAVAVAVGPVRCPLRYDVYALVLHLLPTLEARAVRSDKTKLGDRLSKSKWAKDEDGDAEMKDAGADASLDLKSGAGRLAEDKKKIDLDRAESEAKEKLLRQKVIKSRRKSTADSEA